jgi:hypothetical protein
MAGVSLVMLFSPKNGRYSMTSNAQGLLTLRLDTRTGEIYAYIMNGEAITKRKVAEADYKSKEQ